MSTTTEASAPSNTTRSRRGFSLFELLLVVVVIGVLTAIMAPQVTKLTARNKVSEAAAVVQRDLERAFSTAARLRKAVTLTADNSGLIYQIKDAVGDTLRVNRPMSQSSQAGVQRMRFSPTSVTFQPNGIASSALTVTLTSHGAVRVVTMTRVGLIRRSQ